MNLTGRVARPVQVHPTRRCNLRCLHCYSSSGPHERGELSAALVVSALEWARTEGYNILSVSGGEPLLYTQLDELLDGARRCGLVTCLTTNGMLLSRECVARLRGRLDCLAVSLDGVPDSHDRMRGSPRAFKTMEERLPLLREAGLPFAFLFTLTQDNIGELDWVADFAAGQGARALQIHPLAAQGRALVEPFVEEPGRTTKGLAWVAARQLQKRLGSSLAVQLDLAEGHLLSDLCAAPFWLDAALADIVSPLVIESDGTVVPLQYGFPRSFALGRLGEPLAEAAQRFRREIVPTLRASCRSAVEAVLREHPLPFVDAYTELARRAESSP